MQIPFFNFSLSSILSKDYSVLDNARIRLLYYGLILSFVLLAALIGNIYFQSAPFLVTTNIVLLVSTGILFKALTYRPNWRIISHVILVIGTIINLLDVYISLQNVDAITMEVVIMIVLFSFYMLGQKMGLLYSALNVVPVVIFMIERDLFVARFFKLPDAF